MYNLIVGAVSGTTGVLATDRVAESVDEGLEDFVRPGGVVNETRLLELPTLVMPERGHNYPQVACVGNVVGVVREGRAIRFHFVRNPGVPDIPMDAIEDVSGELSIGAWDLTRTRWSVRRGDLYGVLLAHNLMGLPRPTVFSLPTDPIDHNLVAVMMPFRAEFDGVWEALQRTATSRGWTCQRADDIWEDSVLVNDIVSLIGRAKVVVCDLSGRNSNVFYEAGIAHTLGREVVLITQSSGDVPFDLGHHRHIRYLPNAQGLAALEQTLGSRLQTLMSR